MIHVTQLRIPSKIMLMNFISKVWLVSHSDPGSSSVKICSGSTSIHLMAPRRSECIERKHKWAQQGVFEHNITENLSKIKEYAIYKM